ncbi:Mn-dependent transcriptional regulator [Halalkaliarchaeum desulfuricum]|uniref:Mn-dependent transcriptional regulator n=2 Tax=Halalkaliarchaeum desulfuricum TaxID=2055893 RepID=A0A343TJ29_9EURY|nr:Mn-dependent transcriptional regulator [Halalkaliarchaeum desulfuricum]
MEDYLKAIYILEREEGTPVSTSSIAEHLDKTPPTVTSMIEKLDDRGLIEREKYKGVELTDEGRTVALEVIRHHRLLETYLTEHLDYDWSEVHDEADRLEHHISEEFERRVAELLDDPAVDPHGDPIPTVDLEPVPDDESTGLTELDTGESGIVSRVSDRNEEELSYLADAGIKPGTELTVVDVAPFGMVTVRTDRGEQSLPEEIARSIRVTRSDE